MIGVYFGGKISGKKCSSVNLEKKGVMTMQLCPNLWQTCRHPQLCKPGMSTLPAPASKICPYCAVKLTDKFILVHVLFR